MPGQELGCLATSCGRHSRWCCRHPMPAMTESERVERNRRLILSMRTASSSKSKDEDSIATLVPYYPIHDEARRIALPGHARRSWRPRPMPKS